MLTPKQHELLMFINERIRERGVSPSFDEMREALQLRSKSGIHRLIKALEARGFLRRLPYRARALEVLRLPVAAASKSTSDDRDASAHGTSAHDVSRDDIVQGSFPSTSSTAPIVEVQIMGRIAAGTPVEVIQQNMGSVEMPADALGSGEHYALEVKGDSMINAGILDGDTIIIKRTETVNNGDIVVAFIDDEEATLKRLRRKGTTLALEPANPAYETRIFSPERVKIQGKMVNLMRHY
ncbi:MAG: transcriptional repressor LexA [Parvularculales bacterium]